MLVFARGIIQPLLEGARKDRITNRQMQVLEFIARFHAQHGYPPTSRDIGSNFSIVQNAVTHHLLRLAHYGVLKHTCGKARTLELIGVRWLPDPEPREKKKCKTGSTSSAKVSRRF